MTKLTETQVELLKLLNTPWFNDRMQAHGLDYGHKICATALAKRGLVSVTKAVEYHEDVRDGVVVYRGHERITRATLTVTGKRYADNLCFVAAELKRCRAEDAAIAEQDARETLAAIAADELADQWTSMMETV